MHFKISGSLGDEIALTPILRQYREENPSEWISVECRHPEIFEDLPWLYPAPGREILSGGGHFEFALAPDNSVGPLPVAYAKSFGMDLKNSDPEVHVPDAERTWASQQGFDWVRTVAIDTWAGWPRRRWDIGKFMELTYLLKTHGYTVIEVGASTPDCFGYQREHLMPNADWSYVDQTSLKQTAALLEKCALYVGNDSGLFHLAQAVRTPQVVIFSLPASARAYSLTYPVESPESPCQGNTEVCETPKPHRCLHFITPEMVEQTCLAALS